MADADKTLRYEIKTTADLAAAKEAIAVYEKLDETANKGKPATAPVAAEIKQVTEAMREAKGPSDDYVRILEELGLKAAEIPRTGKATITWMGQAGEQAVKAGTQAGGLAKELSGLKQASEAAGRTLGGLSQGGLGGLITTARGAIGIVSSLATGALGGLLLPILATAGVAFGLMARAVNESRAEMKKWYDLAAESSERTKVKIEAANKAVTDSFKPYIDSIEETSNAYDKQAARVAQVRKQTDELLKKQLEVRLAQADANEAKALAGATSDGERDQISKKFGDQKKQIQGSADAAAIENARLAAGLDLQNAQEAQLKARTDLDAARNLAAQAKLAAENAVNMLSQFANKGGEYGGAGDLTSGQGAELKENARAANAAAATAEAKLTEAEKAKELADQKTQDASDAANQSKALADEDAKILRARQEQAQAEADAALSKQREADAIKIKALAAEAEDARARGDNAGQDKAVNEINKIKADQKAAAAATQAAVDKVGAAAAAIPTPEPISTEKAVGGIIQIGNRIIEIRNGVQREINRIDDAISRVNARIDNNQASGS